MVRKHQCLAVVIDQMAAAFDLLVMNRTMQVPCDTQQIAAGMVHVHSRVATVVVVVAGVGLDLLLGEIDLEEMLAAGKSAASVVEAKALTHQGTEVGLELAQGRKIEIVLPRLRLLQRQFLPASLA